MNKYIIIPTVFAHTEEEFRERMEKTLPLSKELHIDIMDGDFVEATSMALESIPSLQSYKKAFEAHLMTEVPVRYASLLKEKGFAKAIFHYEACGHHPETVREAIEAFKQHGLAPILALNPETPVQDAFPYLKQLAGILLMGVHPGKEHQPFLPEVYEKVARLRAHDSAITIQVDGGVSKLTIQSLAQAGVTRFNVGSSIASAPNPKQALKELLQELEHR